MCTHQEPCRVREARVPGGVAGSDHYVAPFSPLASMAIWKVKSQTAVTVELLGKLPQSDCDRMSEDLQADPPAKTVHDQTARPGSPSLVQVSTRIYSGNTESLPSFSPAFCLLSTWRACWSPWLSLHLSHHLQRGGDNLSSQKPSLK